MKKIIALSSIICLLSVIIFSPAAHAASISWSSSNPGTILGTLVDQYIPNLDSNDNPDGNYALFTYKADMNICGIINGGNSQGYINGVVNTVILCQVSVPSGLTATSATGAVFTDNNNYYFTDVSQASATNLVRFYFRTYFDNYYYRQGTVNMGSLEIYFTLQMTTTGYNLPDPPANIYVSVTSTPSGSLSLTPDPTGTGLAGIIIEALERASSSNDIADILSVINDIKTNNASYYTNLLSVMNTNNSWLNSLFSAIENLESSEHSDWADTYNLLSDIYARLYVIVQDLVSMDSNNVTWLTRIYNKIVDIYNIISAAETQAAQMQTAEAAVQNDIAYINSVNKPNAANIISQGNAQIDTDISSGFGVLATIIGNYNIVWILTLVMVLAFVSYLLYGKGV